jgi:hypothetical protein
MGKTLHYFEMIIFYHLQGQVYISGKVLPLSHL